MLSTYLTAAMRQARYEILPDDEGYYGQIPGFDGLWSNAPTLEACREELASALEDWVVVSDIGPALLTRILRQAGVSRSAWEAL